MGLLKRQIAAGEFKTKCLALLDEVPSGARRLSSLSEETPSRGRANRYTPPKIFGRMAGTFEITGDIVNSLDEEWDAMKDDDSRNASYWTRTIGVRNPNGPRSNFSRAAITAIRNAVGTFSHLIQLRSMTMVI